MLILLVSGLALLLLSLALGRLRHHARLERFGSELQMLAAAFESARTERGRWPETPEEAGPGVMSSGWLEGPPIGGEFAWRAPTPGRAGMIAVTGFAPAPPIDLTPDDLRAIDRAIDDGDLQTGRFRTGFNGWPVYLVTEKP